MANYLQLNNLIIESDFIAKIEDGEEDNVLIPKIYEADHVNKLVSKERKSKSLLVTKVSKSKKNKNVKEKRNTNVSKSETQINLISTEDVKNGEAKDKIELDSNEQLSTIERLRKEALGIKDNNKEQFR